MIHHFYQAKVVSYGNRTLFTGLRYINKIDAQMELADWINGEGQFCNMPLFWGVYYDEIAIYGEYIG